MSCARCVTVRNSQRHEDVRAFKKSWERICCSLRFRGIPLGARPECFPAIPPARAQGYESRRAHLCGDHHCFRQLQPCCSCNVGQCTNPGASIFQNSGVDSALGSVAVSWRTHFRARASCALLKRWFFPAQAGSGVQCVPYAAGSTRAERSKVWIVRALKPEFLSQEF